MGNEAVEAGRSAFKGMVRYAPLPQLQDLRGHDRNQCQEKPRAASASFIPRTIRAGMQRTATVCRKRWTWTSRTSRTSSKQAPSPLPMRKPIDRLRSLMAEANVTDAELRRSWRTRDTMPLTLLLTPIPRNSSPAGSSNTGRRF